MIGVEDDILHTFNFKVEFEFHYPVHGFVFLLLWSFILIENLGINLSGSSKIRKVENLIRVNAEALLHALDDILVDYK